MRIAVVTPYYKESTAVLSTCHNSVMSQTYNNFVHIMVADGEPHPMVDKWSNTEHMVLPHCHADAGATPRALAAISAFSRGFDAVAFLDADNTYLPTHLETMVNAIGIRDVATATRNICTINGANMFVDNFESDGNIFCDTNCLFIKKTTLHMLSYWITNPDYRLWSDRQFWSAIVNSNLSHIHITVPTVNYNSRWAWHYEHAGLVPPPDSVCIAKTSNGTLIQTKHKDKTY